jgi:hypothetical protein
VKNKAGASDGTLTFDCTGAPPKPNAAGPNDEFIRADLSGHGHYEATNAKLAGFSVTWDDQHQQLTFGGTVQQATAFKTLLISTLPLDVTRPKPFDIHLAAQQPYLTIATLTYQEVIPSFVLYSATFGGPGASLTVTVNSWDGTFLEGTFSGTMIDPAGVKPPVIVTNGEFKTRRVTGH